MSAESHKDRTYHTDKISNTVISFKRQTKLKEADSRIFQRTTLREDVSVVFQGTDRHLKSWFSF